MEGISNQMLACHVSTSLVHRSAMCWKMLSFKAAENFKKEKKEEKKKKEGTQTNDRAMPRIIGSQLTITLTEAFVFVFCTCRDCWKDGLV